MHVSDPDRNLPAAARVIAAAVGLLALATLAGWVLDVDALQRPLPRAAPLSPFGATLFLLLAASVPGVASRVRRRRRAARALAAAAAALSLLGVLDAVLPGRLELNQRLFDTPARVALATMVALTLLGIALAGVDVAGRGRRLSRASAIGAGMLGAAGLLGYLLGVEFLYAPGRDVQMAPQAAVGIGLLSLCVLLARPGARVRVLLGPTLGGRFARAFLPAAAFVQLASGVLATQGVRSDLWSFSTAVWLMALSSLASLVVLVVSVALRLHGEDVRRAEDEQTLARMAQRDPLTGAYNRRAFDAEIERAVERAHRYGDGVAVCVIDLDHFKEINDLHGHAAGDDALLRVYRALRSRLRTTDVLGRIGGDEFAAVLTHVDQAAARAVADEMAACVAEVGDELGDEGVHNRLTASIGVALYGDAGSATDLVRLADERMYARKRSARAAG